jgi:basic membrane lipoprotein Med (substrate-binding protein (PBP1-ABC) superfamily)
LPVLLSKKIKNVEIVVMNYKHVTIFLSLIILFIAGCAESSIPAPVTEHASGLKVALLMPRPIEDNWSQSGLEGLKLIEQELGAETAYTASVPEDKFEETFRQYATEEFDFIIGLGGQFSPAAEVVAEEFPRTQFAIVADYVGNNKNLGGLSFRYEEAGYIAGAIAAIKSKTDKVAYIGGVAYPHIEAEAAAFERGAKSINPSIDVSINWVESWDDEEKTRLIAQTQIENGADVLAANVSIDTASEEAEKAGVYAIGWTTDRHEAAPQAVLTSILRHTPKLLLKGATLVGQGQWEGKLYKFGLQDEIQELAPFYGMLSPEEERQVADIQQDIQTGKIDVSSLD